jgi:hypothetical protein
MRVVVARALWYVPARCSSIGLTILKLVKKTDSLKANASRNSPKRGSFCSLFPRAGWACRNCRLHRYTPALAGRLPKRSPVGVPSVSPQDTLIEALLPAHR